jgi:hypothetical protein
MNFTPSQSSNQQRALMRWRSRYIQAQRRVAQTQLEAAALQSGKSPRAHVAMLPEARIAAVCHAGRQCGRDGGVDRVAALTQNCHARFGRSG